MRRPVVLCGSNTCRCGHEDSQHTAESPRRCYQPDCHCGAYEQPETQATQLPGLEVTFDEMCPRVIHGD